MRWRQNRAPIRAREREADERDRAAEAAEAEAARAETERFLAQQAADMAALADQQRAAGILVPSDGGIAPLKLNISAKSVAATLAGAPAKAGDAPAQESHAPGVLGDVDDEEEAGRMKKIRQIELGDGLTDAEREERRLAQIQRIEESVPTAKAALFKLSVRWDYIDEVRKIREDRASFSYH